MPEFVSSIISAWLPFLLVVAVYFLAMRTQRVRLKAQLDEATRLAQETHAATQRTNVLLEEIKAELVKGRG